MSEIERRVTTSSLVSDTFDLSAQPESIQIQTSDLQATRKRRVVAGARIDAAAIVKIGMACALDASLTRCAPRAILRALLATCGAATAVHFCVSSWTRVAAGARWL